MQDRLVPAAAWFYGLTLAFFFVSSLLIINLSAVPPWQQSPGSTVILALWQDDFDRHPSRAGVGGRCHCRADRPGS